MYYQGIRTTEWKFLGIGNIHKSSLNAKVKFLKAKILYLTVRNNNNNEQVQTDRTIPNYKPDIIIRDNEKRTCMLIDVAISGDRNVIK